MGCRCFPKLARCAQEKIPLLECVQGLWASIFVHISGSIQPITLIWASLERSFPPAEVEYRWCQFWSKLMTSEVEERPKLATAGYARHRSPWAYIEKLSEKNILVIKLKNAIRRRTSNISRIRFFLPRIMVLAVTVYSMNCRSSTCSKHV